MASPVTASTIGCRTMDETLRAVAIGRPTAREVSGLSHETAGRQRYRASSGVEEWWAPSVGPWLDAEGTSIVFSSRQPGDGSDPDLRLRSVHPNAHSVSVHRSLTR